MYLSCSVQVVQIHLESTSFSLRLSEGFQQGNLVPYTIIVKFIRKYVVITLISCRSVENHTVISLLRRSRRVNGVTVVGINTYPAKDEAPE